MMNSRSRASRSSGWAALLVVGAMGGAIVSTEVAEAGRKRVVVLDFEGPKGGRFHDDLVRLIKKTHEVVSTDRWNDTADGLAATEPSSSNIKKVAKKLKVDAVIEGKIEKRRDEFIIRLKLHAGSSGELIGSPVDTKAENPKIEGRAQRDIKDELLDVLDAQPGGSGGSGGSDLDEDAPSLATRGSKNRKKKVVDDEDEDKPRKSQSSRRAGDTDDEDEDKPSGKGGFSKHFDSASDADGDEDKPSKKKAAKVDAEDDKPAKVAKVEKAEKVEKPAKAEKPEKPAKVEKAAKADDEDKLPPKKPAKADKVAKADDEARPRAKKPASEDEDARPRKRTAARDGDEDDSAEVEAHAERAPLDRATALSAGERAIDADLGIEAQSRTLNFQSRAGLLKRPNNYGGNPNPGARFDLTVYPMAVTHSNDGPLRNLGVNVYGQRAFHVTSQARVPGEDAPRKFHSFDSRFGFGAVYRYAFNRTPMSPVVIGSLGYSSQQFSITADANRNLTGLPNVRYKMIEPGVGVRYPFTPKITGLLEAKVMGMLDTGQIQGHLAYGTSKITGFEGMLGVDYLLKPNLFVRAAFAAETIGFAFVGNGVLSETDNDPMTKDVTGARDTYIGGMATIGYAY